MSKIRRSYSKAEKLEIVSLSLEAGQTVKELAVRYGISENTLYTWRKLFAKFSQEAFSGKGKKTMSDSERRIAELEKQLRESQLECEILKKAVGIFSQKDRRYSNL